MAAETRPFGELFEVPTRNGLTRPKEVRGTGVKMVNMGELFAHPRLINAQMDRVPLNESEALRFLLKEGDLLFARQSLVLEGAGKCSIFKKDNEPVTFESHVTRVRLDPRKAAPDFYYYYLQSYHGQSAIRSIVEQGAGASGIRGSDLERLDVLWRPVEEQRAIAHILGTLDDKIDLNRKMNETLEAIARALFKSWFVDFEPARAKAEGRDTGLPKEIADLFPDSFEDSELGEVPKGWRAVTLGDVASNASITFDFKRATDVVFINTGDVLEGDFLHSNKSSHVGLPGQAKKSIQPDDILFSEIRPANKRYAYVDFSASNYVVSTKFMVINASKEIHPRLLYRILTRDETLTEFQIQAESRSGTFPQITFDSISYLPIVLPHMKVQEAFQKAVRDIDARIKVNKEESRTLAAQRDALLPKLLSGEVRVESLDCFTWRND